MKKQWGFLSNSFEITTRRNYKKMSELFNHHFDAIMSYHDGFFKTLQENTVPVHNEYTDAYNQWTLKVGNRKGQTKLLKNKLKELYQVKLPSWDITIQTRFPERTTEYKKLFKNGRTGFWRGPYDTRIRAISELANILTLYDGLFVVREEVKSFYEEIHSIRGAQSGSSALVKAASLRLEAARKAAAVQLYANLGSLMVKYCNDTSLIKKFFHPEKLRDRKRKPKKIVTKRASSPVVKHTDKIPVIVTETKNQYVFSY
jgi:hypothetical protein